MCGDLKASLFVSVQVEFALTEKHEVSSLASIKRASAVDEGFDVDTILPIKCEVCNIPSGVVPTFNQGQSINICLGYDVPSVPPGVCMLQVDLRLVVEGILGAGATASYGLSNPHLPAGWVYGPGGENCSYPYVPFTGMFKELYVD